MRCFIGLPLPEEYQKKLEELIIHSQNILSSKISWTKKGNWHLTLCFLGELTYDSLQILKEELKDIKHNSFTLKAGFCGFFPSIKKPRVLWLGLEVGGKETKDLAYKIFKILEKNNIHFDKKDFIPHLTIGRIKKLYNDKWEKWSKYINSLKWQSIKISSFVLWQSTLTPKGPIYTPIEEYRLL